MEYRLTNVELETNLDKSVRFTDFKERLKKCEELLNIKSWDDEKAKILDEAQRQIDREVDSRVVPIEKRMKAIGNQMISLNKQNQEPVARTPKQQREDALKGALRLLNNCERMD